MNNPNISKDPEIIRQVWGLKPYTVWRIMCGCCGVFHTFDMPLPEVQEALIEDEWEFRRTGPWCPGCCEDQRRRADEVMQDGGGDV